MPSTKPDTDTGWTKLVIMDTDRGSEVWPDAAGSELTAIFAQRADADFFVAAVSGSQFHNDKIRNAAFNIASAFPDLNCSDQPINPNGELVNRIAYIIQADFPLTSLSPSDFEQLIRLRNAAKAALPYVREVRGYTPSKQRRSNADKVIQQIKDAIGREAK